MVFLSQCTPVLFYVHSYTTNLTLSNSLSYLYSAIEKETYSNPFYIVHSSPYRQESALVPFSGYYFNQLVNIYSKVMLCCVSPEFLQSRVEVPMLGIVTGGAMAFMALLILSLIVLCLMQKNKSKTFGRI